MPGYRVLLLVFQQSVIDTSAYTQLTWIFYALMLSLNVSIYVIIWSKLFITNITIEHFSISIYFYIFSVENQSTDSGPAFRHLSPQQYRHSPGARARWWRKSGSSPGDFEKIHPKIGNLEHVAPICSSDISPEDVDPEEGDCRYMARELLAFVIDRSRLTKADIFRNTLDNQNYENIKKRKL